MGKEAETRDLRELLSINKEEGDQAYEEDLSETVIGSEQLNDDIIPFEETGIDHTCPKTVLEKID